MHNENHPILFDRSAIQPVQFPLREHFEVTEVKPDEVPLPLAGGPFVSGVVSAGKGSPFGGRVGGHWGRRY